MARRLVRVAGMFKIGSQLFTAKGPAAVARIAGLGADVFLDLKFHDIPNTVAGAASAAASFPGVRLLTVHTLGGLEMMRAAARSVERVDKQPGARTQLLGVTVLTSLDGPAMRRLGIAGEPKVRAVKLARLAQQAGLDGVVASAQEAGLIRRECGKNFLIVVPGVRRTVDKNRSAQLGKTGDQTRVATPAEAIRAGADYLVVGRPITAAADPCAAAQAILDEISQAEPSRI